MNAAKLKEEIMKLLDDKGASNSFKVIVKKKSQKIDEVVDFNDKFSYIVINIYDEILNNDDSKPVLADI